MMFAYEIADAVRRKQQSVRSVVEGALARAETVQTKHNAFITIAHEHALARADALDNAISGGEDIGVLAGVPVVIKDNICTKGLRTTAGSTSLHAFVPPYSATVIERLEAAGAVIIAKANLDEFGMGGSCEHSLIGACSNAWDSTRIAGGSSGGSAVAVAAGVAPIALGTDTGGSVRRPAALNGVLGYKPTYGVLSRYGVIAFASSLDQVGVLARSNRDVALAMQVMAGRDSRDATSIAEPEVDFASALEDVDLTGVRIGVLQEMLGEGNSDGVRTAFASMMARLQDLGATVRDVSLPHSRHGVAAYYLVAPAEASSNLARYDGMIYSHRAGENALGQAEVMMRSRGQGFGEEVRRRVLIGTYALSAGYYDAYYGKALKVRRLIADDFTQAFEDVDLIATPTATAVAYKVGAKDDNPLSAYLDDISTVLANLAGIGALSVPAGRAEHDLPCGVQFHAPALADARLFKLSYALEQHQQDAHFAPLAPV